MKTKPPNEVTSRRGLGSVLLLSRCLGDYCDPASSARVSGTDIFRCHSPGKIWIHRRGCPKGLGPTSAHRRQSIPSLGAGQPSPTPPPQALSGTDEAEPSPSVCPEPALGARLVIAAAGPEWHSENWPGTSVLCHDPQLPVSLSPTTLCYRSFSREPFLPPPILLPLSCPPRAPVLSCLAFTFLYSDKEKKKTNK